MKETILVKDNGYGGAAVILLDQDRAAIRISQVIGHIKDGAELQWETREAEIIIDTTEIPKHSAGDRIEGAIVMIEQQYPYDEEMPELYLAVDADYVCEMYNGKHVWRYYSYSEDANAPDKTIKKKV